MRAQHSLFAHQFFPSVCLTRVDATLLAVASSDQADDFLASAWRSAERAVPADERVVGPPPTTALRVPLDSALLWVVAMPPATETPEAHFLGLLFLQDDRPGHELLALRYFTLEHSHGGDTVLGGWTLDREERLQHLNFGLGPDVGAGPDVDAKAFADAVFGLDPSMLQASTVASRPDKRPKDKRAPRPQLFILAHHILRDLALGDPDDLWTVVSEGRGPDLVAAIWNDARTFAQENNEPVVEGEPLTHTVDLDGKMALLVQMPPGSINEMEPHFVCVVFETAPGGFLRQQRVNARYFTLDAAWDRDTGEGFNGLGGWERTAEHEARRVHHKAGVPADRQAFLDEVGALYRQ